MLPNRRRLAKGRAKDRFLDFEGIVRPGSARPECEAAECMATVWSVGMLNDRQDMAEGWDKRSHESSRQRHSFVDLLSSQDLLEFDSHLPEVLFICSLVCR